MGPGGFSLLIQILPTFWATRILIVRIFIFWIFVGSQNFWLGPARAHPAQGPSPAQPRFLEIWGLGNLGIWNQKKNPRIEIPQIKIRSAQNVGKVWISRKKSSRPHLGQFFPWTGKIKKIVNFCKFSLVGQWALFTYVRCWTHMIKAGDCMRKEFFKQPS